MSATWSLISSNESFAASARLAVSEAVFISPIGVFLNVAADAARFNGSRAFGASFAAWRATEAAVLAPVVAADANTLATIE